MLIVVSLFIRFTFFFVYMCTLVSYTGNMKSRAYTRISLFLDTGLLNYTAGHLVNIYVNIYRIKQCVCIKIYIYRPITFASDCSPFLRVFNFSPFTLQILTAYRIMS